MGDPAHGKTALRSWLEHDEFREPGESTRGGEVGFRNIPLGEAKGRINIWDFGGQYRYRPAQQPLFTPGALYLLVCKGRLNIQESGVEEWLRLIQLRAGRDARVLLIFTHMSPHDGVPSLAPLSGDLRQMIKEGDVFAIDSPSRRRPVAARPSRLQGHGGGAPPVVGARSRVATIPTRFGGSYLSFQLKREGSLPGSRGPISNREPDALRRSGDNLASP